jgi:hypothetical protein
MVFVARNGRGSVTKWPVLVYWLCAGTLCDASAQSGTLSEREGILADTRQGTLNEPRGSLAGERAAQELSRSLTNEDYNIRLGPVRFQTQARLGAAYTDNVFLSGVNKKDDFIVNPEIDLAALLPVGQFNSLRLSLGLSYEWFAKNHSLNSDVPLVNPDSELAFYLFVGDFRIKMHEKFSYQQTLVFDQQAGDQIRLFNFSDVGRFDRLDNVVGPTIDWDLNKVILTLSYDHENFISTTERFKYLNRSSEWLALTANYLLGDRTKAGLEGQAGYHNYDTETTLNDNWRGRGGPFMQVRLPEGLVGRAGGGYEMARFDSAAGAGNDYDHWYAYGKLAQEMKWFTHSVGAGHETLLGDNANNLRTTYVRYSISTDAVKNTEIEGHLSANFSREFGGGFKEKFIHYLAGCRVGYQFHKYWRTEVAYELFYKDSEFSDRVFHRNRVSLDLAFRF